MLTEYSFLQKLREITPAKSFCIALSGGLDSTVLMDLFYRLTCVDAEISVRAIHINHGIHPGANDWEKVCQNSCLRYQLPLTISRLSLSKKPKISLEADLRSHRYAAFKHELKKNEVLVTAHHLNDQAETMLLQLFRGAGPKGLASMPISMPFGEGILIRPLLNVKKERLEQYAKTHELTWVDDDSNYDAGFDRNFLRNDILPLLEKRWPSIMQNLSRSAQHCAKANLFIEQNIKAIFASVFNPTNRSLLVSILREHPSAIQNYVIRYWLQYLDLPLPSTKKLLQLKIDSLQSRPDSSPVLTWQGVEIRRFNNELYAMSPLSAHDHRVVIPWDLKADLMLPNNLGIITRQEIVSLGIEIGSLHNVTIRFRQGGERCKLLNRKHSHSLKKLLQAWQVPPWQRARIPLLYIDEKIKAIIPYAICE